MLDHSLSYLSPKARFAVEFARQGLCAAFAEGEDSTGKQALRNATVQEIAKRACETAEALWSEFEVRGWFAEKHGSL